MQYSEIIYLENEVLGEDEIGNVVVSTSTETKCYAKKQSVRTNEFYSANQLGLTPTMEFVIKRLNYDGQKTIKWNNELYEVIREVDPKNKFDIVLVCSKKVGV